MVRTLQITIAALALLFCTSACKRVRHIKEHRPLQERIKTIKVDLVQLSKFAKQRVNPVDLNKGVKVSWTTPARTFHVLKRDGSIKRYPCSGCHKGIKVIKRDPNKFGLTHGGILIKHGKRDVLKCESCHNKDDQNLLRAPTGQTMTYNKSFKLCASCHSKQTNDWAGGAHGKRQKNWLGPRLVKNCTACHNPHVPTIRKRWPSTYYHPARQ